MHRQPIVLGTSNGTAQLIPWCTQACRCMKRAFVKACCKTWTKISPLNSFATGWVCLCLFWRCRYLTPPSCAMLMQVQAETSALTWPVMLWAPPDGENSPYLMCWSPWSHPRSVTLRILKLLKQPLAENPWMSQCWAQVVQRQHTLTWLSLCHTALCALHRALHSQLASACMNRWAQPSTSPFSRATPVCLTPLHRERWDPEQFVGTVRGKSWD